MDLKSNKAYATQAEVFFFASLTKADEQRQCRNSQAASGVQNPAHATKWDFTDLAASLMTERCGQVRMEPHCSQKPANGTE